MFAKLRPSPAMLVAILALVVALGGTAFAGPVAHLAKMISGSTIEPHSTPGNRLENDTLTGQQIKESSLGSVPKATSATNAIHASRADRAIIAANAATAANANAVGGVTVHKVFYAPATASPTPRTILSLGGLTLSASCGGGTVEIIVTSAVNHSHFSSEMFNSAGGGNADGLHHTDFNTTSLDDLTDGNAWGETSFTYTKPGGTIVNGQVSFDSSNVIGGDIFNHTAACLVSGFAMSTVST